MTEAYIISGFLGSGKTTLIKTIINTAFKGKKIAVIENDFGEARIDASLLEKYDLKVNSLTEGCICCSLAGDLKKTLEMLLSSYAPEVLLIEPSGVGKLSDILKSCFSLEDQGKLQLQQTITTVDVRFFDKYRKNYGEIYEDQILYGDMILFSHQKEQPNQVLTVMKKIKELNPEARIETGSWSEIPGRVFRYGFKNSRILKLELEQAISMKPVRIRRKADSGRERKIGFFRKHFAGEIFSSVTLKCDQPVALEELKRRVMYVVKQAEGEILRGKGIFSAKNTAQDEPKNLVFHFVPGYLSIEPTSAESDQVCFIGTGLDREQIKALWNEGV